MEERFLKDVEYIISVLRDAGYEPYDQLYAYLHTGSDTYITRKGNARALVAKLDKALLWDYIAPHIAQKGRK